MMNNFSLTEKKIMKIIDYVLHIQRIFRYS